MDPEVFAGLTDRQIWQAYFRPRDKNGRLVREAPKRARRLRRSADGAGDVIGGVVVPDEAYKVTRPGQAATPPFDVIHHYFAVKRRQGLTTAQALERYKTWLQSGFSG